MTIRIATCFLYATLALAGQTITIQRAAIARDGVVAIRLSNGKSVRFPVPEGQEARDKLVIAKNRRAVGWLELDTVVGVFKLASTLSIYMPGRPIKQFGDLTTIVDWHFVDDGRRVEFASMPAHGPGTLWLTWDVYDVATHRRLKRWRIQSDQARIAIDLPSIVGRVVDGKGAPIADAEVSTGEGDALSVATSDATGHFRLEGIQAGEFSVRAAHPGYLENFVPVENDGSAETVDAGDITLDRQPAKKK